MKFGDVFYVFDSVQIHVPRYDIPSLMQDIWIGVITKRYYISDVTYFNGRKAIELCSQTIKDIEKNNRGRWYGCKREYRVEDLDSKIEKI